MAAERTPERYHGRHTATTIIPSTIDLLEQQYVFGGHQRIVEFLGRNSRIAALLVEAHEVIPIFFGPNASTRLDVIADPNSFGQEELLARVYVSTDQNAASEQLDRFDHGWWMDRAAEANGLLNFDVAPT